MPRTGQAWVAGLPTPMGPQSCSSLPPAPTCSRGTHCFPELTPGLSPGVPVIGWPLGVAREERAGEDLTLGFRMSASWREWASWCTWALHGQFTAPCRGRAAGCHDHAGDPALPPTVGARTHFPPVKGLHRSRVLFCRLAAVLWAWGLRPRTWPPQPPSGCDRKPPSADLADKASASCLAIRAPEDAPPQLPAHGWTSADARDSDVCVRDRVPRGAQLESPTHSCSRLLKDPADTPRDRVCPLIIPPSCVVDGYVIPAAKSPTWRSEGPGPLQDRLLVFLREEKRAGPGEKWEAPSGGPRAAGQEGP